MRKLVNVGFLLVLVGCATMQVNTPGRAIVPKSEMDYADVFTAAMRAVRDAGFTLEDSDREAGLLYAEAGANPLISNAKNLKLSIQVVEEDAQTVIDIQANLSGQMVAYGATKKVTEKYCESLAKRLPTAKITIDGKLWGGATKP